MSAEKIKIAIDRWKLFYKDNIMVNCNKSEEDTINDIMDSSAGLKGWSESSYELRQALEAEDEDEEEELEAGQGDGSHGGNSGGGGDDDENVSKIEASTGNASASDDDERREK